MELNLMPKNADYHCTQCDFKCCKKSNWNIHVKTKKHIANVNGTILENLDIEKNAEPICQCGKKYTTKSGLWKHKVKCAFTKQDVNSLINDKDQLILMLVKQNSELIKETSDFKNIMMEVMKNGSHNTTNNHTNSHNKAFNLQFFLNETCKDAMNIMDFVESIQLQLSDLEKMGEIGYVEGISNIIVKNLNALDVTQRPVHCTDKKRETIYIKDDDKWEKDDEKSKIRKVIKKVATKNARLIQKFKEKHPDYNEYHSKYSTQYHKLIIESFGGSGDNDLKKKMQF